MRLIGRVLWVMLAFLIACVAAATVTTLGLMLPELSTATPMPGGSDAALWMIALTFVLFAGYALIPAMLLIALAEGFRLRSFLFYSIAGAVMALLLNAGGSVGPGATLRRLPLDHDREVLLASGIAGGLIYWALAGRSAGIRRRRQQRTGLPAGPIEPPDQDRA